MEQVHAIYIKQGALQTLIYYKDPCAEKNARVYKEWYVPASAKAPLSICYKLNMCLHIYFMCLYFT